MKFELNLKKFKKNKDKNEINFLAYSISKYVRKVLNFNDPKVRIWFES